MTLATFASPVTFSEAIFAVAMLPVMMLALERYAVLETFRKVTLACVLTFRLVTLAVRTFAFERKALEETFR